MTMTKIGTTVHQVPNSQGGVGMLLTPTQCIEGRNLTLGTTSIERHFGVERVKIRRNEVEKDYNQVVPEVSKEIQGL